MRSVVCFLLLLLYSMAQAQNEGTVSDCKTLKSEILKGERRYAIYLPPGYDSSDRSYPLLISYIRQARKAHCPTSRDGSTTAC